MPLMDHHSNAPTAIILSQSKTLTNGESTSLLISYRTSVRKSIAQPHTDYTDLSVTGSTIGTRVHIRQQGTQRHDPRTGHRSASISTSSDHECPLCIKRFDLKKEWEDHLAQHLQELALFVLPRADEDFKSDISADEYGGRVQSDPSDDDEEWVLPVGARSKRMACLDLPSQLRGYPYSGQEQ